MSSQNVTAAKRIAPPEIPSPLPVRRQPRSTRQSSRIELRLAGKVITIEDEAD